MPSTVSPTQGHIDAALSIYAQKFRNTELIGDLIVPRVNVNKQSDLYWVFGRENLVLPPSTLRAAGSPARRIVQTVSATPFFVQDHALERFITDEERGNFDPGDPEQWATEHLTDRILLQKENDIATFMTDAAVITQGVTLDGTTGWDIPTTSFPIQDVQTGHDEIILAIGKKANTLILSQEVFSALRNHADLIGRIQNVKVGLLTMEDFAAIFDVERVLVGSAIKRTAAGVNSFVWGKHAVLAHIQMTPSMEDLTLAKSFVWGNAPGSTGGFITEIGRAQPISRKSDEISVHFYYEDRVVAAEAGYLITDAVT